MQRSGNLYKHNSSVRVRNSNTYGFTLSMNANQPNMVNDKDSTYKIDSVSGTNKQLAANQWGYGMGKNATTFNSVTSATLADVTSDSKGNCTSVDDCTLHLTFGANLDQKRLPTGSYSTSLTYTATSKPAPYVPPAPAPEPPEPKWTTNGCVIDSGSLDGDNCQRYDTYDDDDDEVTWNGKRWVSYNGNYDYAKGKWIMVADEDEYNEYDKNSGKKHKDNLDVRVYIPRFAREGNHIRFCKENDDDDDDDNNKCSDEHVEQAFGTGSDGDGFFVSLSQLGCKDHVSSTSSSYTNTAQLMAAQTLVEAFGSPCPK